MAKHVYDTTLAHLMSKLTHDEKADAIKILLDLLERRGSTPNGRKRPVKLTTAQRAHVVLAARRGKTPKELAGKYEVSTGTICRILRESKAKAEAKKNAPKKAGRRKRRSAAK